MYTVHKVHNLMYKSASLLLGFVLLLPAPAGAATRGDKVSLSAVIRVPSGALALVRDAVSPDQVQATLARWDREHSVVSSGVNAKRSIIAVVSDPEVGNQWGYARLGGSTLNDHTQGDGVVVAVIDTGVDASHPDLEGKVLQGWDSMDPAGRGTSDPNGHGTHVAGIIAASTNNGIGVAGMAPKVSILPVRVLDHTGNGDDGELALGIVWAADNGADILNISIGGAVPSALLEGALDYALGKEIVVVVAAGNDAMVGNVPSYPGAYRQVLTVGAMDSMDKRSAFSNTGDYIDVVAPGSWIRSTWPGGGYQWSSGTSMAAPFVSASAALLLASRNMAGKDVALLIKSSALDLGPDGVDTEFGDGLVNPLKALGLPEIFPAVPATPFMPSLVVPGLTLPNLPPLPQLPPLVKKEMPSLPQIPKPFLPSLPPLRSQPPELPQLPELTKPSFRPAPPVSTRPATPPHTGRRLPILPTSSKHTITIHTNAVQVADKLAISVRLKGLRPLTAYTSVHVVYAGKTHTLVTNAKSSASFKVAYQGKSYVVIVKKSSFLDETTLTARG